jgi:hypothetical protein
MDKRYGIEFPAVTPDEAVEFVIHHLKLAAMFYEACPEDNIQLREELIRICRPNATTTQELRGSHLSAYLGGAAFIEAISAHYVRLRQELGE